MLPPSAILSHHSHHLYHPGPSRAAPPPPLLPSALPRRTTRLTPSFSYTPCPHHATGLHSYRYKPRSYDCLPPFDGSSPISSLPDELWLEILKFMDWEELLKLRSVNRKLASLALSAGLHHSMTLTSLPPTPLPAILTDHLLPPIKHLHLHLFPYPSPSASIHPSVAINAMLNAVPTNQLRSLSLPFSAPYLSSTELGEILRRTGGRLEKLDLRGSGVAGKSWSDWMDPAGKLGPGLRELDLGFTNITELPTTPEEDKGIASLPPTTAAGRIPTSPGGPSSPSPLRNIISLSLASCTSISPSSILTFLRNLPPSLVSLDFSRLEQTSFEALWGMKVVHRLPSGETRPTALKEIKVVGIDHLTRLDIRRLKRHWEAQRRACDCFPPLQTDDIRQPIAQRQRVWGEPTSPETGPVVTDPVHMPTLPHTPFSLRRQSISPMSSSSTTSSASSGVSRILTPESADIELSPPPPSSYDAKHPHPFLTTLPSITTYHRMDMDMDLDPVPQMSRPTLESSEAKWRLEMQEMVTVNIIHSAILESEDEAGYRQFIGEVAGGTVGLGLMDWERGF